MDRCIAACQRRRQCVFFAASINERDVGARRRKDGRVSRFAAAALVDLRRVCRFGAGRESTNDDVIRRPSLVSGIGFGRYAYRDCVYTAVCVDADLSRAVTVVFEARGLLGVRAVASRAIRRC